MHRTDCKSTSGEKPDHLTEPMPPMACPGQAAASDCQGAVQLYEIEVFDFLSYEHVHLPFNEGYLRVLRAAYPGDRISFRGVREHIERLAAHTTDLANIKFLPCKSFETPFAVSHHNPVAGRWAARQCLNVVAKATAGRRIRLTALLGFNASLLGVMSHGWPGLRSAPLHMILHGQLGEAMVWRSRNPLIRAADFISQLRRPLPRSARIVALELGVKETIVEVAPTISPAVVTLEHPILRSEWAHHSPAMGTGRLKIGFVGHARRVKGFEVFVQLASSCSREDIEFHAIGHSSPETDHLDTTALARRPSKIPLPREEYVQALGQLDLVCLPVDGRAYESTGSGTVSDAVAALKPMIVFRNRTMEAIFARYGAIGWLVDNRDDLFALVRTFDPTEFARQRSIWIDNLKAIRKARSPEALAKSYAAAVSFSE